MKYELINEPMHITTEAQILYNRGFRLEDIPKYLSLSD